MIMNNFNEFVEYLPFLLPILVAEVVLAITAFIHVLKHPNYRFGNKVMWSVIVLLVQVVGPIVYFLFGRGEE